MKTPHKHAELIKAWADGAEIEAWVAYLNTWEPCTRPVWSEGAKYRIKPEPKPDVVMHTIINVKGFLTGWCDLHFYNSNLRLTFDGETGKLKKAEVL